VGRKTRTNKLHFVTFNFDMGADLKRLCRCTFFLFCKCRFILVASSGLTNICTMVELPLCPHSSTLLTEQRFDFPNWRGISSLEDGHLNKEYRMHFILHTRPISVFFWHSIFHDRDWIQQSQWQTAARLMRAERRQRNQHQLMETSRWGAPWPKMTCSTNPRHILKSDKWLDKPL